MRGSLRILIIEVSLEDAALLLSELQRGEYDVVHERVETAETLKVALDSQRWDIVFANCNMPHFAGPQILAILREKGWNLPVILLSSAMNEDLAVSAMKAGANDYLLKSNLKRLLPVVEREMHESNARRERREAEEALRQSEERFRQLAENITEVFWMCSLGMKEMLYISPGYEKIWGRSCKSLYERPTAWLDAIHPEDRGRIEKAARAFPVSGRYDEEYRIVRPDGVHRWIHDRAFPVRDAAGQIYRITGIAKDITNRKLSEKALKDAKEFSENLIQTANVIILGLDTDGNINLFNRAAEKITGYTSSELNGKNWFEILVPKDRYPHVWEEFTRLVQGGAPEIFENPILTKTGQERYVIWRNNQVRVDGKIAGTISFGNDITDLWRATAQHTRWERVELTKREKEVLSWVMAGKSNSDISAIMNISPHGIDFHLRNLFKKLGVTSRVGAALRGVRMGLIDPD
ncbi:MAG: PAS domain S-box protein [Candidatus Manganitrophus sp.]|nr:PAS domain S-box protein [Candidatus Manganitrophus sp.]WDT73037.1 MAG: PAS domain S-box protein [Candidatus Manganitrophus sp.]WDT74752.1 MAG: PAS domain S-box protein [Candidatus Manganitrophus sp.]WDT79434.1 MAG: PAS domain S-box protein [Candidatus Manganitrophus sp.]